MTDPSTPDGQNPYTPPPAGAPSVPPAGAPSIPPAPRDPAVPPAAYQPPAPEAYEAPQAIGAPGFPEQGSAYPAAQYPPAPQGPVAGARKQSSPQTSSIISLVAGAVSIFLLPYIAGIVGIGLGVTTLRLNAAARRTGAPVNGAYTGMAIAGIALGALGIILKIVLDFLLR
ncbi:DUF4190 domain-containing protein [Streptomyces sp. AC495_CC817]|uniref:DUF4190 domain-containing protein n=1 Tax=Streptomyces sp. AC495_CC817 TaxID=2823900 RepID=UPI001C255F6B|nr:DUF4190 domain-containing protein [Streptomyces sp. AC495_CC817]